MQIEFVARNGVKDLDLMLSGNFNTFRHGNKWTCLVVGETVELITVVRGPVVVDVGNFQKEVAGDQYTVLGLAVVTGVTFGSLNDMIMDYAHDNHETPDEIELVNVLASIYGPEKVGRNELYTVVHLVRMVP